jgi:hypothetical protein
VGCATREPACTGCGSGRRVHTQPRAATADAAPVYHHTHMHVV